MLPIPSSTRAILHVDMDAFYASVEQRGSLARANTPPPTWTLETMTHTLPGDVNAIRLNLDRLRGLLPSISSLQLGFPVGEHAVHPPTGRTPRMLQSSLLDPRCAAELRSLYVLCGGLSLPDIHNGIFVHSSDHIDQSKERGEPTAMCDGAAIAVIGSDGGGNCFVVTSITATSVLKLDKDVVASAVQNSSLSEARVVAPGIAQFIGAIADDVAAFCQGATDRRFLS